MIGTMYGTTPSRATDATRRILDTIDGPPGAGRAVMLPGSETAAADDGDVRAVYGVAMGIRKRVNYHFMLSQLVDDLATLQEIEASDDVLGVEREVEAWAFDVADGRIALADCLGDLDWASLRARKDAAGVLPAGDDGGLDWASLAESLVEGEALGATRP